jgi:hypothetical protein
MRYLRFESEKSKIVSKLKLNRFSKNLLNDNLIIQVLIDNGTQELEQNLQNLSGSNHINNNINNIIINNRQRFLLICRNQIKTDQRLQ